MAVQRDNEEEREHRVEAVLKQLRQKTDAAAERTPAAGTPPPDANTVPKDSAERE